MLNRKIRKIIKSVENRKLNQKYEMIKLTLKYFNSFNYTNFDFYSQIYDSLKYNIQKLSLFFDNYILFMISIYITDLFLKYKNINIFLISLIFKKRYNYNYEIKVNNYINNLYYLQKYSKNSSISIIKNMCIDTTRSRGILTFYKLSRIKLKEYGTMGLIPGIRKSSW